jgi:hypothetical protein
MEGEMVFRIMQSFKAQLSESIDFQRFLDDWKKEPGNDGFGNPPVEFHLSVRNELMVHTFGWDEESLKRTTSIAVHRSFPNCKVTWGNY